MSEQGIGPSEEYLNFGTFQLSRGQRVLTRDGDEVPIGARALDILIGLVEHAGEVVTKRELMAFAWPHTFVDETNLRMHVAALRKLLSEDPSGGRFILNVKGQGYLFTQPVHRSRRPSGSASARVAPSALPVGPGRLYGRERALTAITSQLVDRRLVTIVGPAGVGKSAIALAMARTMMTGDRRVHFVELSAIDDPATLVPVIAAALDISVLTDDPLANLIEFVRGRTMLLVLDNCEHIIEAVTPVVEALLAAAPSLAILATSREPLRSSLESLYRLPPLDGPLETFGLSAAEALAYPAIELFVERARDSSDTFRFDDTDVAAVTDICVRLDGLPLAIELVAARIDLFGLRGLASALGERLMIVAKGSRTALRRQQSIQGALDWSYDLLSPTEQLTLRRFAIFRGPFSLESAIALVGDTTIGVDAILEALASLSLKSLIVTDTSLNEVRYRLLHVTRSYAGEKLRLSGEGPDIARRHAEHVTEILAAAEAKWETTARPEWVTAYGYMLDDVRAALDWAYSPSGDDRILASLTTASLPFGFQLSLIDENKLRIERALDVVGRLDPPNPIAELRLVCALAVMALSRSTEARETETLFERITTLSDGAALAKYRIAPLSARAIQCIELGELTTALSLVGELSESAREHGDPLATLLADRVGAQAHHFAGNHVRAKSLADQVIRHPARNVPLAYLHAPIDRQISMRIVIARALWLEGRPTDAKALMEECLALAAPEGPLPMTFALALGACPLALWSGDFERARALSSDLITFGRRYTFDRWERLGVCYSEVIDRRLNGTPLARSRELAGPVTQMQSELLATCDPTMIDGKLVDRARAGLCGWANPEILRISGLSALGRSQPDAKTEAETAFTSAIEQAKGQGALAWEVRAATSLARLWLEDGRVVQAHAVLGDTLARCPEPFGTHDLAEGGALLQELEARL